MMTNPWFDSRQDCPACGSDRFTTIYQGEYEKSPVKDYLVDFYSPQGMVEVEYLKGATYILSECDDCALIFQRDIPNEFLMERLYEHWIDPKKVFGQHQANHDLAYYSYFAQEVMQVISFLRKDPRDLSFLDFGMGWGEWALMAKAFGCESAGTELSLERVEFAKSNGIKAIIWEEIPEHRFDFINTEQVFEHIPQPLQTLKHLRKALKPEGMLKICVPPTGDIGRRLKVMDWKSPKGSRNSLNAVAPLEHINCFKKKSLLKMAAEAEMEEVFIPVLQQYQQVTDWRGMRRIAKNILRPIYRNWLRGSNYIFLRNVQ
jgi:SAM-dependent methyltransferase